MSTKTMVRALAVTLPAFVLLISGFALLAPSTHADTGNYKQAFTASGTSVSGVFDVAGDESGLSYWLNGATSGSLECTSGSGAMIDVADLSSSGTLQLSNILPAASGCNPAIFTTAHLIQDMREGKIAFVSGGTTTWLTSGAISTVPPSVTSNTGTMGGTGTATSTTATSTDMTGGTATSTGSTASSTTPTLSASSLRVALNTILQGHVATSLEVLRAISYLPTGATTSPELTATLYEQDQNAIQLSQAIGLFYGQDAGTQFLALFRAHIVDSNAYTMAVKNGNEANKQAALDDLDLQLQHIASFLSTANPNLDYNGLLSALRTHENLVNESSVDYTDGDYTDAYNVEQQALTQISGGADYIAAGIVAQFPSLFTT